MLKKSNPKNPEHDDAWKLGFVQKKMSETGFQLEDEVFSIFKKELNGCDIEPTYYFSDWETSEERELDFLISFTATPAPIMIEYVFLIECKQLPDNYWVFVKDRQPRLLFKNAISMWDDVGNLGRQEALVSILSPIFRSNEPVCDSYAHRYKELLIYPDKLSKSVKSNKRDDNIRSSEIKLAKAYYSEEINRGISNKMLRDYTEKQIDHVTIFYPMIVFQGNLFESDMLSNPPNVRFISSSHLYHFSIQNRKEIYMVIDVVKIDHLTEFIQTKILPEITQIRQQCAKFKDPYLKRIKTLRDNNC